MRTTLIALLGALALAGCSRRNATTSTLETRSADLDRDHTTAAAPPSSAAASPAESTAQPNGEPTPATAQPPTGTSATPSPPAAPAPTALETLDHAAVRPRAPNEHRRAEAGRSVDAAAATLGPAQRGEDRLSNVGRSTLSDVDAGSAAPAAP